MKEEICNNCEYWISHKGNKSEGECHRRSPSVIPLVNGVFTFLTTYSSTEFPETEFDDWCGEFKEEKEPEYK